MPHFEKAPPDARALLPMRIREFDLRIEGSAVEPFIARLYDELDSAGLRHFRPACYLTDEWGCPSEEPIIGIPFYLADPRLADIENAMNDIESEREIMMYMRHEAGHAFNYAYELFRTELWRETFGPFRRAYRENYRFVPFSRRHVRHIGGWYAQKHPDEDFAETFAVWLTPGSDWRDRYRGWPAMAKLEYVDTIAKDAGEREPLHTRGKTDITAAEIEVSVEEFYRERLSDESAEVAGLPLETDLRDIFHDSSVADREDVRPAADLVGDHRRDMIDKISYWTGIRRSLAKTLVETVIARLATLELVVARERQQAHLIELTAYLTTLAMNYVTRGGFTHS